MLREHDPNKRRKAMKIYASFALYVFSIALAVGIGVSQVGKGFQGISSGKGDCPYEDTEPMSCGQVQGQPPCGLSRKKGIEAANGNGNIQAVVGVQCVACEDADCWSYELDPSCQTWSLWLTSEGCTSD